MIYSPKNQICERKIILWRLFIFKSYNSVWLRISLYFYPAYSKDIRQQFDEAHRNNKRYKFDVKMYFLLFQVEAMLDNESDTSDQGEDDFGSEAKRKGDSATVVELLNNGASSSSSEDSLSGDYPKGFKRKRGTGYSTNPYDEIYNSTEEDESPSVKFRRGESLDDDMIDMEPEDTQDSNSLDPPDEVDDGEWNMMGAALEREFLANN